MIGGPFRAAIGTCLVLGSIGVASAQSSPSAFTSATRYDPAGHVTGTIAPDPDGSGPLHFAAVRNTYDADGRLITVEKGELSDWQSEMVAPSAWPLWNGTSGFQVFSQLNMVYDQLDRKIKETVSSGGTAYQITQYSYDLVGRLDCTAVRMNPAMYGSLPVSACTLGTEGSYGPDRITRNGYDYVGQLVTATKAYGTPLQQVYVSYTYTDNGKQATVKDANGNKAGYTYDGFDRLAQWNFPDKVSAGTISTTDYEAYTYDANSNRLSLRKRDGNIIGYTYDALNRVTVKDIPGGTAADVYYAYDVRGLQLSSLFGSASGAGLTQGYDGFGQLTTSSNTMGGATRTLSYLWDVDGDETRITYPDGIYVTYGYDGLDRVTNASWTTLSATTPFLGIAYDAQGRRISTARGSSSTAYSYDPISRLSGDTQAFASGSLNTSSGYTYNPASQIVSKSRSNDAYAFGGYVTVSRAYASNGLNQYTSGGPASFTYDANGNLTGDGTSGYAYDVENRLVSRSNGLALAYDPNGRLWQTSGAASGTTRYLYDGDHLVAEYDASGTLLKRYVFGPGVDEPVLADSGSAMNCTQTQFLHPDAQGSIVANADCFGNPGTINTYDEYGIPGTANSGRFQYTGQAWLPDLGMYYYKARIYSPTLGRFLQTDPIGYKDQINLYAYVANDPVNGRDPQGTYNCDKADCSTIAGYVHDLKLAAATPETGSLLGNSTLQSLVKFVGNQNDGNKIDISLGSIKGVSNGLTGFSAGRVGIKLDPSKIGKDAGAAVLGHELVHGAQFVSRGQVKSLSDEYRRERAAYRIESYIDQSLNIDSSVWHKGITESQRTLVISERADDSCEAVSIGSAPDWKEPFPGQNCR